MRYFLLFLLVLFPILSFANVTIVNGPGTYPITIRYAVCNKQNNVEKCELDQELTIPAYKRPGDPDGFVTLNPPIIKDQISAIVIRSAVRKDDDGNILAKANFCNPQDGTCFCRGIYHNKDSNNNYYDLKPYLSIYIVHLASTKPQISLLTCTAFYNFD